MAKLTYGIPKSLDSSFLDIEVAVQNKDGLGMRSVPLKVIMIGIISIILIMFILFRTFIGQAGLLVIVLFGGVWALLTAMLVKFDKTRRMGVELVPVMLNYVSKPSRIVNTMKKSDSYAFMSILGIEEVENDGRLLFADGSLGYVYSIVGSASTMLFAEDRDAIIDRFDTYFRKVDVDVEHILITTKESQRIHNQLAALENKFNKLEKPCRDLVNLVNQQRKTLKEYVGGRFQSIHQYLVLRAKNQEALQISVAALVTETSNSSMVFRHCASLSKRQVIEFLHGIFGSHKVYTN